MSFIPDTATLIQFAIATVILAITPGPDMTLFVSRTLNQGRATGFASMAGALCGTLIHTTLVVVGVSALIVASPMAFFVLKIFGAGYLVFLAWQAITRGSAFSPEKKTGPEISLLRSWAAGLGVNLLNPKIILFFMTFLPQFVSAHDPNAPGKLFFLGLMFIVLSVPVTVPMVLAAEKFSAAMKASPRVTRVVDYLFAGVFSAFALKILTAQAK
ncbi:LysE family translocator [Mesorhizobium sp. M7A.F.Ca.CA.001.07.2.1]|jgi:threonine/homoserine/homoserine lactone efflux protein|uniref:LysE family translocator n=1 Tax=Mesorhizobium TaxID=68287 RepID=UPI000FCC5DDB|nr:MULTISPECIES: LysE family translocator [Mesorhizobium]RUV51938.1 LysE family translocator [Mesorhizobium sp. M7A.F.Ca.MR.228.00.0.0]MCF6123506.1 LysE family translocator [Mesorhizobium ciceri]MCQ8815458.1 LysE family translocator [Mesorhizobium sp. SEMIA396]MCQ8875004.1 LysE family translocator [Mesorhizobium sp. LMG17149]RUU81867.1 LysE family translocator [Mesorhizobium sp. M7A.F.Ca.MR.362.00.0.0]